MCSDSEKNMSLSLTRITHQVSRAFDLNFDIHTISIEDKIHCENLQKVWLAEHRSTFYFHAAAMHFCIDLNKRNLIWRIYR